MRASLFSPVLVVGSFAAAKEAPSSTTHAPACTATASSGTGGGFFDLRPDTAHAPEKGKQHKTGLAKDYHSRGYDYGKNFTLNICAPVVDHVTEVVGVSKSQWANVSAYYTSHGNVYSIGSASMDLKSRGRKLVLQYTGGSPCGASKSTRRSRSPPSHSTNDRRANKESSLTRQPHEVETLKEDKEAKEEPSRRKSTTISFLCDRDPTSSQASISFVGVDEDECSYFFEGRSSHACAQAEPHKPGSVGPGSVFGIILVVAFLVYVLGGVFYNRAVTNARGWRQLPNYSLWAGIWSFLSDMFVIAFSSCARCLPGRRGYSHLGSSSRNRNSDAENRLIDQLDEEWDD
ncbi:Mannose-6-phosphate receptor, binding protein [Metarhizium album ARSEF 1941]|uniref:Mannose-6-phosphate receptor, binding protein n=1 Tax=Metarhizium album (strain ARSEF 1941) TaxID=1081103 RepID=A0A0B2WM16_METAS|nr:Mannose-6-phosphate receptor, binding protein [Metarhizium album ARSEF 1941]KHN97096.1 Mannose-6-phosphate receptor, binding protein [Metarhizium album ARSEF 1941]